MQSFRSRGSFILEECSRNSKETMQRFMPVFIVLAMAFLPLASADTVSFDVSIDTSSVAGDAGGIYLSFSPGYDSDPASVAISGFSPAAGLAGASCFTSGPCFTDGGVTGSLDTNDLVFTNYVSALNDYGETLTFGSELSFVATFDLPNTLTGESGSELDIGLTEPDLVTPVLTSDPSGYIASISYDQNGVFSTSTTSDAATVTELVASTPEPRMLGILLLFAGVLIATKLRHLILT